MIRIGTRKSPLAVEQAEDISRKLRAAYPDVKVEFVYISTSGDLFSDRPLTDIGGKGLFTKEIEEALLEDAIDIAVHSVKDMQTVLPDGLMIGCMPAREDPRDTLVGAYSIDGIPENGSFGTASLRRGAQILMYRPDLTIVPLRGNVQSRLAKIQAGVMDATMLARAGLNRLGLVETGAVTLPADIILPAVGQGAVAVECRKDDARMRELLAPLSDTATETVIACERAFLNAVDGSCRMPIAGHARLQNDTLIFDGLLIEPDGTRPRRVHKEAPAAEAETLGWEAGREVKG